MLCANAKQVLLPATVICFPPKSPFLDQARVAFIPLSPPTGEYLLAPAALMAGRAGGLRPSLHQSTHWRRCPVPSSHWR